MGRKRKKDSHLPRRVYLEHGRYWYKPKKPKTTPAGWKPRIDLGTSESEMYAALAKVVKTDKPMHLMDQVFDKYIVEVLPTLAPRTQDDYRKYIAKLRPAFKAAHPNEITGP